jgi:hypothetical protein
MCQPRYKFNRPRINGIRVSSDAARRIVALPIPNFSRVAVRERDGGNSFVAEYIFI